MGLLLFALATLGSISLWIAAAYRLRKLRPLREAVPERSICDLDQGRFRIRGRVVPVYDTVSSPIDGVRCVYLERAEYRSFGSTAVPIMREVNHGLRCHLFFLDDGTGRIVVDPSKASIEAVTVFEDGGLSAERRLRADEEVELVASFARAELSADGSPYRSNRVQWAAISDEVGPPQITFRTSPEMLAPVDDLTMFLKGAGGLLFASGTVLGMIVLFL